VQELENLLNTKAVTYAQASRFVLEAADVLVANDPEEAFQFAAGKGWLPENASPNDEARLDGIALLLAGSFDVKGGLLFSFTNNSRYAYRELKYADVISGRVHAAMPVSGERLVYYANSLFERGN